ncbi:hypothetical protein SLEP1_g34250 [Rubroshorea leprosula]|uniref:Secreted protein n=1 Tax=Rubroshorea leprosula TaxID=152421 RepID=A0AAV5KJ74_9ROSI|nr:hypothetical protein SLEP1_g34250 [Rubroshorea leprosula]
MPMLSSPFCGTGALTLSFLFPPLPLLFSFSLLSCRDIHQASLALVARGQWHEETQIWICSSSRTYI